MTYQDSPPARDCHFRQQPYSISTKARMGLCRNISEIQVLVTNFFRTSHIKLKLGLQVGARLQIATHSDQSNYLANKKQEAVNKYDVTVFIRLFQGSENCGFLQGASSLQLDLLMSLIQDFQCRLTHGTLVEILLFWLPLGLPYQFLNRRYHSLCLEHNPTTSSCYLTLRHITVGKM